MYARQLATIALTATVSLFALGSAGAQEADEIAKRLKDLWSAQGAELNWTSIDDGDADVVLRGATTTAEGGQAAALGDILIDGVEELKNGDFRVESLQIERVETAAEGQTVVAEGIVTSGLLLPAPDSDDVMAQTGFFESLDIDKISFSAGGKQTFVAEAINYAIERSDDGKDMTFVGTAESFSADLSGTENPQTKAALAALNLMQPTGSIEMSGAMSLSTGVMTIDQMDFNVDDAGTLGMTMNFAGVTADFIKAAQELSQNAQAATEEQKAAQGLAALGLMQQLSFAGASIRYDDDSLANRALDLAGGMQNMKRSDMAGLAKMMLPGQLGQYVTPQFAQKVADEVAKFIENPTSLEIRAAPAQPVPFALIGASALTAPQGIPDQIGLTVTANQPARDAGSAN